MIRALETSASALVAQRTRLDVIAGNMANAFTTQRDDGVDGPYRRRVVSFQAGREDGAPGVHVERIIEDPSEFRLSYEPGHPDAMKAGPHAGYVRYPNVNLTMEYVDALEATRAYELNVAMMNVSRSMLTRSIELFA
ncbi:MAG: flagellar basal body rod protein FlgC [Planctomycetota bacterium]|nr:MAG: flagellar basal body rod protein FlgC [Planctomycetota bacterium]